MKEQDYKLTMSELEKEYKENYDKIEINGEKAGIVRANSFENKAMSTLVLSLLPYVGLTFAMITNDNLASMTGSVVPMELAPAVFMVGAFGVGTLARKIYEHKSKNKERFESFSDAKTETEKTVERIKYLIEKEKAWNRKKAIIMAMDLIEADQNVLRKLSEKYEVSKKEVSSSALEVQKELDQLTSLLEDKFKELDILSTQRVLHEKTWEARSNSKISRDTAVTSLFGGMLTMMYYTIPCVNEKIHFSSNASALAVILTTFAIGAGATIGYKAKINSEYMKAFNSINSTLGEDSLPETITDAYEEQHNIEVRIGSTIKEVAALLVNIQEAKRTLESLSSNSNEIEEIEYSSEYGYSPSI